MKKCHGKLRAALLPADVHLFIGRTSARVVISDLPPCVAKDNSSFVKGIALDGQYYDYRSLTMKGLAFTRLP